MGAYFLDSSALVKRYVAERGTSWVTSLLDPRFAHVLHVASIAGTEVVSALCRRRKVATDPGSLSLAITDFRADFASRFVVIDLAPSVITESMDIAERHTLRAYDSVQLAAGAMVDREYGKVGLRCTFVSADALLLVAAISEGLLVANPEAFP